MDYDDMVYLVRPDPSFSNQILTGPARTKLPEAVNKCAVISLEERDRPSAGLFRSQVLEMRPRNRGQPVSSVPV